MNSTLELFFHFAIPWAPENGKAEKTEPNKK